MSRSLSYVGGAVLLTVLVLAYAAFSLVETERKVLASAEAEGRALLQAVSAGVERTRLASRTVERLVAARLLELARAAGDEIASRPGQEERVLHAFALRHRLRGVLLLDRDFRVVASAGPAAPPSPIAPGVPSPLAAARLEPRVEEDLVRQAREEGLGEEDQVVVEFGENPLAARLWFLAGVRIEETGGYVLLRRDAESLRELRENTGVDRLLAEAAASSAISYLVIETPDGTPVAGAGSMLDGQPLPPPTAEPSWQDREGGRVLDLALPVSGEGLDRGRLRVGLDAAPVEEVLRTGRESILLFTGLIVLLGAGGATALVLMDRAGRRKREAFERELGQKERTAAMGQLAAGVAHEVRSPLNAIGMAAQRLDRQVSGEKPDLADTRDIVASMHREIHRLNLTIEEFLDLGRSRPLSLAAVDLPALVREVRDAEAPEARLEPPGAPVALRADGEEIRKLLGNLVRNARQAAGKGPVAVAWRAEATDVVLEVRDGGPGIPEAERARVFEHLYTGRAGGTGLGLAIVRAIAERHGGSVTVARAEEGGASFVVRLPSGER